MDPNVALLEAFRDVRNGKFGRYDTASSTSYVVDPTDGTLWDLKPVLWLALQKLDVDESRGYTTHELARICRQKGVVFEQIVFANEAKRPLGLRSDETGLDPVDWTQLKDDRIPSSSASNYYFVKRYDRKLKVITDALAIADGVCQGCKQKAPFRAVDGRPFLEVHHIIPLSLGGPDVLSNVVALCPNCHRKQHFGKPDTF
jgi:hypothetical protein